MRCIMHLALKCVATLFSSSVHGQDMTFRYFLSDQQDAPHMYSRKGSYLDSQLVVSINLCGKGKNCY